jgi:AraC-like DNA-binding protein
VILLSFNPGKINSTFYLGVFFFLVSFCGLNQYALVYSKSVLLISILSTNFTTFYYLIGPFLYWYIKSVLTDNSRLRKTDLLHLLPALVYLLASLPYILSPYSHKVEIATAIVKDISFLGTYRFTILSDLVPVYIIFLGRPVLILAYTLWSIGLFIRFLIQKRSPMVFSHQNFMTKWLTFFLVFQFILVTTYLISTFETFVENSDVFLTINVLQILAATGMVGLLISPFFFPSILYGLPHIPVSTLNDKANEKPIQLTEEGKNSTPSLESDYILAIQQKVDSCIQESRSYLDPELNLNRFSDILQFPAHHLAYYFREVKKQSFNDYCNNCRVEYAKDLIREGKAEELTLEAVGKISGFTNRSTFFRAFKKAEGVTPGYFMTEMNRVYSSTA